MKRTYDVPEITLRFLSEVNSDFGFENLGLKISGTSPGVFVVQANAGIEQKYREGSDVSSRRRDQERALILPR